MKKIVILFIILTIGQKLFAQQWQFAKDIGFMADYRAQKLLPTNNGFVGLFTKLDSVVTSPSCSVGGNTFVNLVKYDSSGVPTLLARSPLVQSYYDFDMASNMEIKTLGAYSVCTFNSSGALIKNIPFSINYNYNSRKIRYDNQFNYYILTLIHDTLTYNGYTVSDSSGQAKLYLLKFNSNDNLLWSKKIDVQKQSYTENDITIDNNNNIVFRAFFSDSLLLNGNLLSVNQGIFNSALFKFDPSGNLIWYQVLKGTAPQGAHVKVDNQDNIYVAGRFCDTLSISGSSIFELKQGYFCGDAYISKLSPNGQVKWISRVGTNYGEDNIQGFAVNGNGICYVQSDWPARTLYINSDSVHNSYPSMKNVYMLRLDSSGNKSWFDYPYCDMIVSSAITADNAENVYFTGMWNWQPFVLGGDSLTMTCGNYTSYHFYLARLKYESTISGIIANKTNDDFTIFPNPSSGNFTIASDNLKDAKICVYDVLGNCILTQNISNQKNGLIDLSGKAKGIYFVEVNIGSERRNKKIILN